MNDILAQIAGLSPEKRELLELLLKKESLDVSHSMIIPRPRDTNTFPLSFAQQRLWFLDQLEPGSPMYNIPSAVRLSGRLDVPVLEQSLNEIVRRHEALRTTFSSKNGQPVQVIAPKLELTLPVIDLRHLPESEREGEVQRLANEEAQRPFDLSRGPLLRTCLLRLADEGHVALLTMHHIISDGWSMGVLIGEIAALYEAFRQGYPSPLPDLAIQYADYAHWQREWLRGDTLERQLSYWKQQLGDSPPVLALSTDRPRPAFQTSRGASLAFGLSSGLFEELKALSKKKGTTLFITLLAAFQALLYRYTGQEDISVGTPVANRNHSEIEGLIGFFVNTLVMRTDLSGDPSFEDLLERVRKVSLDAYAHQDLPFEMLVEELQPERDMSHTPLFQVMFAFQNAPMRTQRLPGLTLRQLEAHSKTAKFDLTLTVTEEEDRLSGALEYNADLFDTVTIERMLGHFQKLLEGIVANPNEHLSKLAVLTTAERRQLLVEWNDTAADYPQDLCLSQLFEAQVGRTPDSIAVIFEGEYLTYRELNTRANQLAYHLQKLGVGPEVLVGVCLERSPEMVVGLLGILKAGGAYLPLDPHYPKERLAFMLDDAYVSVLLTVAHLRNVLPDRVDRVVCLDTDWAEIAQQGDMPLAGRATAQNLAYVLFTSGSTGRPKGIAIERRSTVALIHWARRIFPPEDLAGVLASTSISWDLSVFELFVTLSWGGTVILAENALRLVDLPAASDVVLINTVPSAIAELLRSGGIPGSVRTVNLAGEPLRAHVVDHLYQQPSIRRVFDLYGPGEDTTYSTFALRHAGGPEIIGRPINNSQIYLMDSNFELVPIGVPGELYIGGAGLARGYLNRPELTAEKFIPNPFSSEPGARLYKTGDLVRYCPDGNLEFLGRIDHQVKVRGFRIELGEIETVLRKHPALKETMVMAREDTPGDRRLVAYVVPEEEPSPAGELRRFLKEKLPEYMVPSAFVTLEALPLTPNGKVDRGALPSPDWTRPELERAFVAPRTPVEEVLSGIWAQVLGVEQIGVHDNFFELGGHSLLAIQLVSRLREAFQVELPLRDLFKSPTIAALAASVEAARRTARGLSVPPVERVLREGELPLSFAQQRLWFLEQLGPGTPLYNIPSAVRFIGQLDVVALEQSLNEIVRRHEILRTIFATVDGQAVQVITPQLSLRVSLVDLSSLPPAEREPEALRLAAEEAQRPFDLVRGPLLRARLLRLDEEDHVALLTMHHIVSDGWSTGVLVQEIAALYPAFSAGQPSPLPDLPIQYADFAHWQRQWLQGEVLEKQLDYWKRQLAALPPSLELPTDRPRPAIQSYRGAHKMFALPKSISESLKILSHQEGTTLFITLLAAFQALLFRYTGQEDISVGAPIANRNRGETEKLIGFFVNTLVMRTDLSGNPSFRELLDRVREVALSAYDHQDVPFEMLVDELQVERSMSHTPLFQVVFALQNAPTETLELPGLRLHSLQIESGLAKFDLVLTMVQEEDGLHGAVEYNADLFDATTIERMLRHFEVMLEGIVADPDRSLSMLPLLTEAEKSQLLVDWNATTVDFAQDQCIHQLVELQVKERPDAIAVTCGEEALSYAQLNCRANQLAHYLHKLGVGPGTLVGLCVERSPELVVGALGVLKAGGAYVPVDPLYPEERLVFILEDTRSPVLLTQAHLGLGALASGVQVICLDADWGLIAQEREDNPTSRVTQRDLAYVIYTSGSTGWPKGVQLEQKGLLNLVYWHQRAFDVSWMDRVSQIAGPGFDASVWEVWSNLAAGASIHIPDDETRALPLRLRDWLVSKMITFSFVPTPLAENMLALEWPQDLALRALWTGGDKLHHHPSPSLVYDFVNNYGPTEDTVIATSGVVPPKESVESAPSIGRPIANTQIYLLDACLQPVPMGVPGELHIGGTGLARGYLNRPELTAERFIPNPFSSEPGARLYKTGDLARYLPDGTIEFLGRTDHQVKVRGFRIELGEIEAVLEGHSAVRKAIVLAREDAPGDKRLVAYFVPARESVPGVSELRSFLKEKLPTYMVPSAFIALDTFPLTPNGKVDRQALPAPHQARPELDSDYVAPHTSEEETLADIWAQLLGVEQVGLHDNFFELGGDSILGIQAIARANQVGLHLTPRQLFESPTVGELAAVAGKGVVVQAEQGIIEGPVHLTPIQKWFFEQNLAEPQHWNQALILEVKQPLNPSLLERALRHLIEHHDALRLRFEHGASDWQQVNVGAHGGILFEWIDLSGLSEAEQGPVIEARAAELQASADLSAGLLLRVAYFDTGSRQPGRLLIVVHHLAIDGVSWRILLEDLQMAYLQLSQGKVVRLPPKTTSFKYWARRLQEYAQTKTVRQALDYWLRLPWNRVGLVPVDFPGGENIEASARSVTVQLSVDETQALLQEVSVAYRTEIDDVMLAALVEAFNLWMGRRTLLIELERHGREDLFEEVDLSRTGGWFTMLVPVVLDVETEQGPAEVLMAVKEQLRQVPQRGISYGLLRYLSEDQDVKEQLRALPQPQVSFNYLGQFDRALPETSPFRIALESRGPDRSLRGKRSHVLEINGGITGERLGFEWTFSENLHRRATVERLAQHYIRALRALIDHCLSSEAGGVTPTDFPLAKLNQKKLDKLLTKIR